MSVRRQRGAPPHKGGAKPHTKLPELTESFLGGLLGYLLATASHAVSVQFERRLKRYGIRLSTWRILAILHIRDGLSIGELAPLTLLKQPTATKAVSRLERMGFVVRRINPKDGRIVHVHLTASGRRLVSTLIEEAHELEMQSLAGTKAADRERLKAMLRRLIRDFEHPE